MAVAAPVHSADGRWPMADGQSIGGIGGSLALRSTGLFSNVAGTAEAGGPRVPVMDRAGVLLAHPDPIRVFDRAAGEPGLATAFARWQAAGSRVDAHSIATLSDAHLVALPGISKAHGVLAQVSPQAIAIAPLAAAGRSAWRAAAGVAMAAALVAGWVARLLRRPNSRRYPLAERMLIDDAPLAAEWPQENGEVGEMARAFRQVAEQRQARPRETQVPLQQLRAVLDHAEVGIAMTREARFELVSRQFARIVRCGAPQLIGQSTRSIHASDTAYAALSERASPAFMAHGAFDGALELMRHGGAPFWAPMHDSSVVPGDRSQGTIWAVEDVTEMRNSASG